MVVGPPTGGPEKLVGAMNRQQSAIENTRLSIGRREFGLGRAFALAAGCGCRARDRGVHGVGPLGTRCEPHRRGGRSCGLLSSVPGRRPGCISGLGFGVRADLDHNAPGISTEAEVGNCGKGGGQDGIASPGQPWRGGGLRRSVCRRCTASTSAGDCGCALGSGGGYGFE